MESSKGERSRKSLRREIKDEKKKEHIDFSFF